MSSKLEKSGTGLFIWLLAAMAASAMGLAVAVYMSAHSAIQKIIDGAGGSAGSLRAVADEGMRQGPLMILFAGAAMLFALAVACVITYRRQVSGPLQRWSGMASELKAGNLNAVEPVKGSPELERATADVHEFTVGISRKLDEMMAELSSMLARTDTLRKKARETELGAESQATQMNQVASTSQEISHSVVDIAKNASSAASISLKARDVAMKGKESAAGAIHTVDNMTSVSETLGSMIEKLNGRVKEIGDIISVIEDIADQTNLLALNAAIEAARAGDQGRGFAVVADEVRKLAERTVKATAEISGKINAVQSESAMTTKSMEEAAMQIENAKAAIHSMGDSLSQVEQSVRGAHDEISQIAVAVEEQSSATEEISSTIEHSSMIASNIYKSTHEVLSEIDDMTSVIDKLRSTFAGIKTGGEDRVIIDLAKGDHRLWVNRVAAHINGKARLDASTLADHKSCRLGKWYYGAGMQRCGQKNSFKAIEDPHMRIHALGKEIVTAWDNKGRDRAEKLFAEMEAVSRVVIEGLDNLAEECRRDGTLT